ncbi:NnrU family protein [Salinispirillum sp. LH 10-3-1]|uniref:NnrU family protein n=1 Tax=Salinispirillum sp. LH 10-3-1 TaxID=2952525 RepID=A0AB38YJM7_9GAMM
MAYLILGLVLFLGIHSVRMFADGWRTNMVEKLGEGGWKGLYTVVAIVGLVLVVWGYGQARLNMVWVWIPPIWTAHLAALLTVPAFILLAAAYVPGTHMKAKLGHPMVLSVKVWALAHLLANGTLADIVLFGSFLVWAIVNFAKSRRRDRAEGVVRTAVGASRDAIAVVIGLVAWVAFAFYLHAVLIGVRPFG